MLTCLFLTFVIIQCLQGHALTHVAFCSYMIFGYSAEISSPVCCRVTQTPGKDPTGIRCRHYRTCSLDHSPRCLTWMRIHGVMIRLQGWYALTKEVKQQNGPKPAYPCKVLPVNASSAKETVAGFLPSTSPTDAQNINTGSWYDFLSPGISWALVAALWRFADRTTTALMFYGERPGNCLLYLSYNCRQPKSIVMTTNRQHAECWHRHYRLHSLHLLLYTMKMGVTWSGPVMS